MVRLIFSNLLQTIWSVNVRKTFKRPNSLLILSINLTKIKEKMKRTTRNAEKSRQEIIEKAAPIFNKYGYAGSKLDMIIKATGFKKGGIYCHFDSKMHLAREVFKYNFLLLKNTYLKETTQFNAPKEQLLAFLNGFKKYIIEPPIEGGCPLLNMSIEADDTDETNRLLVKQAINEWKDELEKILEAGIQSGDFQPDINPTQEAFFIMATIEGSIMLGQVKRSIRLMQGIAENLQHYIKFRIFKNL